MATIKNTQKINPCLWFNDNAEDAVKFYTSIFENSKIGKIAYYGEGAHLPKGTVLTVGFTLEGQEFLALNGGPIFKFTEAVSFVINCDTQKEIDYYWEKLSEGGEKSQCGWLKDKFGLSWQVVPSNIHELMTDPDEEKSTRVMKSLFSMQKLDINDLERAYNGHLVN